MTDKEVCKKRKRKTIDECRRTAERTSQKGRKLKQYVLEEKLDIIDYAKVIGNRAAGREFNVAESSIREWRKNEQRLSSFSKGNIFRMLRKFLSIISFINRAMFETAPERSRLDGAGRRPVSEDLEKALLLYVASTAVAESPLTWQAIKEKANNIWMEICEKDPDFKEKDFAANMGWVARFVRRNNIRLDAPSSSRAYDASSRRTRTSPITAPSCRSSADTATKHYENSSDLTSLEGPQSRDDSDCASEARNSDDDPGKARSSDMSNASRTTAQTSDSESRLQNDAVKSPLNKRRRKSFTPKKIVAISLDDSSTRWYPISGSGLGSLFSSKPSDITVISATADDDDDDDENIDVCF
ncbi:hypothetical protein AB6A40_002855 [Gnathostoma spinigerum]|uniref:HTH CENPB-type domain-containing protein n=1 Tax=Gnathostoma spinigerum TaxID=75299 RepID=A0ABD6E947_9BILA